jgi:D-alanyl-D-alanine carboxypeptidase
LRDDLPSVDGPPGRKRARAWPWLLALAVALFLAARLIHPSPAPSAPNVAAVQTSASQAVRPVPLLAATAPKPLAGAAPSDCDTGLPDAAAANAASLSTLAWAPFRGRQETGWETYAPRIAGEIGATCSPASPAFAAALARWQGAHRLAANGVFDAAAFKAMNNAWSLARPFVVATQHGACPPPPRPEQLVPLLPADVYGKPERLTPQALSAYRRMVADARAADPAIAADPKMLTVFSAYRDPAADAADCATRGNCGGAEKANCSAHRTGMALDLVVGSAPGQRVDSSADSNRLAMSKTPAYRWLVLNAGRYGFQNYAFEPWHWEWVGDPAP